MTNVLDIINDLLNIEINDKNIIDSKINLQFAKKSFEQTNSILMNMLLLDLKKIPPFIILLMN